MSLMKLKVQILHQINRFQFQVNCFAHKARTCDVTSSHSHHLDHELHVYHTCCFVIMLLILKVESGIGCSVENLALKSCLFKNPHRDHSGKCLVSARTWHVMIDKTCTPEPQQTPKRRPKVISSSPGQLYNWARGRWEDMERDNEALELQFVARRAESHQPGTAAEPDASLWRVQGPSASVAPVLLAVVGMCVTACHQDFTTAAAAWERSGGEAVEEGG